MNTRKTNLLARFLAVIVVLTIAAANPASLPQSVQADPPDHVVKLIFIHHSTGENWLRDDYGGLGRVLGQNNYFVSDTNYSWGPDSIGDRTDIPDWVEWFASEQTPRYMDALFNETGQHADYTRTLADPGGENEIILFKSCFPNSALEGNPDDGPDPEGWLSVGHARYVYNEILQYFASRPDKLFVVITAPPLSDREYAENARAFNNWLVNDWLSENQYTLSNVAVFDFYNVLTSPDAHHRLVDGQIEHVTTGRNTLYYPSGDDHPSEAGSQKATEEFLPLLNLYYQRWQASDGGAAPFQPDAAPAVEQPAEEPAEQPADLPAVQPVSMGAGMLDDFEGGVLAGTSGWEFYFQDGTDTQLDCAADGSQAYQGSSALKLEFDVAADSWATCGFYFDSVQDWGVAPGIAFYLQADEADLPYDVNVYGGTPDGRTTYLYHAQTQPDSVDGWAYIEVRWEDFRRAEWEENAGSPLDPAEVTGFAFGLSTPVDARVQGLLWVDDLQLLGSNQPAGEAAPAEAPPVQQPAAQAQPEEPTASNPLLPCVGGLFLPLLLLGFRILVYGLK